MRQIELLMIWLRDAAKQQRKVVYFVLNLEGDPWQDREEKKNALWHELSQNRSVYTSPMLTTVNYDGTIYYTEVYEKKNSTARTNSRAEIVSRQSTAEMIQISINVDTIQIERET